MTSWAGVVILHRFLPLLCLFIMKLKVSTDSQVLTKTVEPERTKNPYKDLPNSGKPLCPLAWSCKREKGKQSWFLHLNVDMVFILVCVLCMKRLIFISFFFVTMNTKTMNDFICTTSYFIYSTIQWWRGYHQEGCRASVQLKRCRHKLNFMKKKKRTMSKDQKRRHMV